MLSHWHVVFEKDVPCKQYEGISRRKPAAEGFPGIELLMKQQGGPRLEKKPRCCAVEGASSENILRIFEMMFADDTNLLTTKSQHQRLEHLLESVLLNWGQTVHPDKWDRK